MGKRTDKMFEGYRAERKLDNAEAGKNCVCCTENPATTTKDGDQLCDDCK